MGEDIKHWGCMVFVTYVGEFSVELAQRESICISKTDCRAGFKAFGSRAYILSLPYVYSYFWPLFSVQYE